MSTVYFTDRDLGRQFPTILRETGITVEAHGDHFAPSTEDETWLAAVAAHGWVVVTHDKRIRYRPNERDAVMRSGVALLVLIGKVATRELASNFARTIRHIEAFVAVHTPPYIAKIYRPPSALRTASDAHGHIEMWLSYEDWERSNR